MNEEIITATEIAKILKVSKPTVYKWKKLGLPYIKVGRSIRFNINGVLGWLKKHEIIEPQVTTVKNPDGGKSE